MGPVAVSDRDRKILWGRSGNRCAVCRTPLVVERTNLDLDAVVGEEAHIVARSEAGPRAGALPSDQLNLYDNLILLCGVHHKVVDDQPSTYSVSRLQQLKAEHEAWVAATLSQPRGPAPVEVVDDPGTDLVLTLLTTGADVWSVIAHAECYAFSGPDEEEAGDEACDAVDAFLDLARDWAEISRDVEDSGRSRIREAQRSLREQLGYVHQHGLVAFGGRRQQIVRGGYTQPAPWVTAYLEVLRANDPRLLPGRPQDVPPGASTSG